MQTYIYIYISIKIPWYRFFPRSHTYRLGGTYVRDFRPGGSHRRGEHPEIRGDAAWQGPGGCPALVFDVEIVDDVPIKIQSSIDSGLPLAIDWHVWFLVGPISQYMYIHTYIYMYIYIYSRAAADATMSDSEKYIYMYICIYIYTYPTLIDMFDS